jgi:hypothetical protein
VLVVAKDLIGCPWVEPRRAAFGNLEQALPLFVGGEAAADQSSKNAF